MPNMYASLEKYEHIVSFFLKVAELGVTNIFGYDETSLKFWTLMCKVNEESPWCYVPDDVLEYFGDYGMFKVYPVSSWSFLYFA